MNKIAAIVTRRWKLLIAFNLFVVLSTGFALVTAKPVWVAGTQLILPKTNSKLDANLGTLGSLRNGEVGFSTEVNPLNVQASIINSDTLLEKVLAVDPEKKKFKSITQYKKLFTVKPEEQSTILSVTVNASSPELALQRAIVLTETYQKRLNELRQANSRARQEYNKQELEQVKLKLTLAQNKLAKFKESSGIVNNEEQTKGIVTTINSLINARAEALASAKANENRLKVLSKRLNLKPDPAIRSLSLGENQEYQIVRQRLSDVENSLRQKQSLFTNEHPEIQTLLIRRKQLQRVLQEYVAQTADGTRVDTTVVPNYPQGRAALIQQLVLAESEASALKEQARQLDTQITQLKDTLKSVPENQAKLSELQRQVDVAAGVYNGLLAQIQQNNIDAFDAYPNVQVLDAPQVDPKPISPKKMLMTINAILASVVGSIALVLFLESRNPLLSAKDLQARKFALMQTIPRMKHSITKFEVINNEIEVEFQRLASAISLQPLKNRRLLVTSAIMGEGKTTVAIGLAYALVDLGFKVLLVDGDFRRSELSRRLGYISGSTVEQVAVQRNLDLLPSFPKEGKIMETIKRGHFERVLATCEENGDYDYVIVDSAPVSLTSETALMATIISNVLFVIRPNSSYKNPVNDSFAQLTQHNVQIFGLVINGVESKTTPYSQPSHAPIANS